MTNSLLAQFQQQEAENTAMQVQLNRWSMVMIQLMIQEQDEMLLASDLPVDAEETGDGDNFWEELD